MCHCGSILNKVHKLEVHPLDIAILITCFLFQVMTSLLVFEIKASISTRNFFTVIFKLYHLDYYLLQLRLHYYIPKR
jgi:hypothetical protein